MSTRSVIARIGKSEGEFDGVYHHWNGSPIWLGKTLVELHRGFFKGNLDRMLRVLIDEHNAWSNIVGCDFSQKPGYPKDPKTLNPACYCHGTRHEQNRHLTHTDMDETDVEWLYAFDAENNRLYVRDIRHKEDAGIVDLSAPMPTEKQWYEIECGEDFRRCSHSAWVHGLTPETSNLSTQTWLGNRPLELHDAVGFIINGKRVAATGSGGNSDFYNSTLVRRHRKYKNPSPSGAWIASVKSKNGRRFDVPVAVIEGREYKPFPGVAWIYPPTQTNPLETIVGGDQ